MSSFQARIHWEAEQLKVLTGWAISITGMASARIGAYRLDGDSDTLRVFVNHEAGSGSTFSRVDLNIPSLKTWIVAGSPNNTNSNQVSPASSVVQVVSRGWTNVDPSATNPINNPCTGNVWLADTFGPGRGFADSVYLTGEETFNSTGHIWVMDLGTRTLYEALDLGDGSWENATIIDTGRTDTVALLLSEDNGASTTAGTPPIALYVGSKNPDSSAGFLARNGLVGGSLYYWHADSAETNGTMSSGVFSIGNGTTVSGSWKSAKQGALLFSKSEDVHTNMDKDSEGYGVEVALASQDQAVLLIDCSQLEFTAGDLSPAARNSNIRVLYAASTQASTTNDFEGMDNLVWSPDGNIYVNEGDGEGDI